MARKRRLKRQDLRNVGSLITYIGEKGIETYVGDLAYFPGHGVYDPTWGRLDLTPEEAEAHNAALDAALLAGLDQGCEVGQGGYAYLLEGRVTTFVGTVVSEDVTVAGSSVAFRRNGRTYRGRLGKDRSCFSFRRTA